MFGWSRLIKVPALLNSARSLNRPSLSAVRLCSGNGGGLRRLAFNLSGWNKYGLYHDDCLDDWEDDVAEALRRLPEELKNERTFRVIRANQLELTHTYLPKDQWTTFEDDQTKGRYLQPYLKLVREEQAEKEEWDANN